MKKDHVYEFYKIFYSSIIFFWPKDQINLLLIIDDEQQEIEYHKKNLLKIVGNRTNYTRVVTNKIVYNDISGHDRQQHIMMWADNFTKSEYIGFVDSDTLFVSRLLPEDLFHFDKPRVQPVFGGPPLNEFWRKTSLSTYLALGFKEKFKGMSYFPVVVKRSHLPFIREHIRKNLNKTTFYEAWRYLLDKKRPYSQFNLMVNVLYQFFHDEYSWHITEETLNWSGPPAEGQVSNISEAGIRKQEIYDPYPRLSIHWSYERLFSQKFASFQEVIQTGHCYGLNSNLLSKYKYCQNINIENDVNLFEWRFETRNFSKRPFVLEAHKSRRTLIHKYNNESVWDPKS